MKKYQTAGIGLLSILIIVCALGVARAATNLVQVRGGIGQSFNFNPSNIVIGLGDTILWTNIINNAHDVTPGSRVGGVFVTNAVPYWARINFTGSGQRSAVTFSNLGAYPYICVQHVITMPQPPGNPTQTGLVTVAIQNLRPTVAITSPTNLTRLPAPASFTIQADAADPDLDGSVTNVEFFAGTNLLGADTTAPYSYDAVNLAGGWYQLTALATDNLGGSSTSAVVNVLVNSNRTVEVPPGSNSFSPNFLTVAVGDTVTFNGLDISHTVTGTGLTASQQPFCGTVNPGPSCAVTFNAVGSFPFQCVTHQFLNMNGRVEVVGPNLAPTVRLTAPADGATFLTGAVFAVSAEASDLFGRVATVRFERPPNSTLGVDTESPYSANTSFASPGPVQIQARATDNTGLATISAPITINVVAPVNIQLLSPASGAGGFQFDFTANPGLTYIVEGSAAEGSPTPFVPLATNVANTNRMTFTDSESGGRSNRAYRVFRRP